MTAKIKLNAASGGGSFSLQAPSSSSNNRVITLPDIADGTLLTNQSTGLGKILQVVQGFHSSAVTDTSGSYTDTGLTASITTSASHAGVLVITNLAMGATANNGGDAYVGFNIVRGSTQLREGMVGAFEDNLSGHTHVKYWQPVMNFYDTGTSASTTYTYKCQFKKLSDAVNAFAQNATQGHSYIHLLEIGS
jgi:hypothetical protein